MDLVGYLETLPEEAVARLYTSPWTCQAVLRGLPPLAKMYALRMVLLEYPLANSLVESWPRPEGVNKHKIALSRLRRLQILQKGPSRAGEATWFLQPDFKSHLREAFSESGGRSTGVAAAEPPAALAAAPDRASLTAYSTRQWEALQLYLVGSSDRPPKAAPHLGNVGAMDLDALLLRAKLISLDGGRDITEAGFQFLLLDTFHQLWLLLKQYIEAAAARSGDALKLRPVAFHELRGSSSSQNQMQLRRLKQEPFAVTSLVDIAWALRAILAVPLGARLAKVVSFLLQLGCQGVGAPISVADFDELELSIAADLSQLGLLLPFRGPRNEVWLSPTRMSLALSGGQSTEAQKEIEDGYIVVETNYRVVGYTSSPIKLAILRLFVRCDVVLPNAFVGTVTRESVKEALKAGIGHEQIVQYLTQHAAPTVASNVPVVPAVVADQVRLWQGETRRVQHHKAYLYDDFESEALFHRTAEQARLLGVWLWDDPAKRRLAAVADGHGQLREFIRSNK